MIVVSGCPRNGTSLGMDLMRVALGDDRIIGSPFERKPKHDPSEQRENETDAEYAARQYIINRPEVQERRKKRKDKMERMNPNGFFEAPWVTTGIRYSPMMANELKGAKVPPIKAVKVVSQGLIGSDPRYISKIVYMVREPRSVAKSQEDLAGRFPNDDDPMIDGEKVRIRSVGMYNRVSCMAAKWITENPDVPVLIVDYDTLVQNPDAECERIGRFIGEGNWRAAARRVDPKLRRSIPEDDEVDYSFADRVYTFIRAGNWQAILDAAEAERKKPLDHKKLNVICTRINRPMSPVECEMCRTHEKTRCRFSKCAARKRIDFSQEPCIRDVVDGLVTVEESIKHNHWIPDKHRDDPQQYIADLREGNCGCCGDKEG